jgi:hypothetical protein
MSLVEHKLCPNSTVYSNDVLKNGNFITKVETKGYDSQFGTLYKVITFNACGGMEFISAFSSNSTNHNILNFVMKFDSDGIVSDFEYSYGSNSGSSASIRLNETKIISAVISNPPLRPKVYTLETIEEFIVDFTLRFGFAPYVIFVDKMNPSIYHELSGNRPY